MDKTTKITITGHEGTIGTILVPYLQRAGYAIQGYDLKRGDDILDTSKLTEKLKGSKACLHLAGIPGPWSLPWSEYQRTNVDGTNSVIKACKKAGVKRLVYMSSGDLYGLCRHLCQPAQFPIREDNPLPKMEEDCLYAQSKRLCEKHLKKAASGDFSAIALRLETPHPPAEILDFHFFISISHDNLVHVVQRAIEIDFKGYGVFNIADPIISSSVTLDIQSWLKESYPDVPNFTKDRESLLDISKARKVLGYKPR